MLCVEQPTENAPICTAETFADVELEERGYIGERDYFPEYTEFCRDLRAQAAASGAGYPSNTECQGAYGRAQRETDETNDFAECDRLERAAEIANEGCVLYVGHFHTHCFRQAAFVRCQFRAEIPPDVSRRGTDRRPSLGCVPRAAQ